MGLVDWREREFDTVDWDACGVSAKRSYWHEETLVEFVIGIKTEETVVLTKWRHWC